MIIEGVRAKGFQILSVGNLLHKSRAEIMSPVPANERWSATLTWVGWWLFGIGQQAIVLIFFLGDLLMTGRLLFVGLFAIYDRLRRRDYVGLAEARGYAPGVAVLIPAYNEQKVIERTIRSALRSAIKRCRSSSFVSCSCSVS